MHLDDGMVACDAPTCVAQVTVHDLIAPSSVWWSLVPAANGQQVHHACAPAHVLLVIERVASAA